MTDRWTEWVTRFGEFLPLADTDQVEQSMLDAGAFTVRSLGGPVDHDIAFMKIPKCATSSVHFELVRAYRSVWVRQGSGIEHLDSTACDDIADLWDISNWEMRRYALSYHLAQDETRYVYGHYPVNEAVLEEFEDEYGFVTTLRDPVRRWISHYYYNRYLSPEHYGIDLPLDEFLETDRARGIGRMYTAYLVGPERMPDDGPVPESLRQQARRNLERIDVVGIVDEMDELCHDIEETFGIEIDPKHRNRSPAPEGAKEVSSEQRERIRELCEPDRELYEFARNEL
jgi:hypothetical protein